MKEIAEFGSYSHSDGRLISAENHVSFVLPEAVDGEVEWAESFRLKCSDLEKFDGYLSLHNSEDFVSDNWIKEPWEADGEQLGWQADIGPIREHRAARFRSLNHVGFKIVANDMFGNGLSAGFQASAAFADELMGILNELVDSVQFFHPDPFDQEQLAKCFSAYNIVAPYSQVLFIDQHRFLMRDDVLAFFERVVSVAEKDGNPNAEQIRENLSFLKRCRELLDSNKGVFEDVMAHFEDESYSPD